ncbi:hypothetical protein ACOMHN_010219 [Nucella lapillus]
MVAQGTVLFLLAARNGDLSELKSEKVTESVQDDHGASCLHYAARGGSVEVLKYLVSSRSFRPTRRSKVGATALHDAAATGNLEALRWLLEQDGVKVDDQDGTGATVAQLAARYGHTQMLEWLLDETNCDVLKKSASGAVALHFAAEGGHLECVKILTAEAPRSVNMQMNNGSTPAYLACQRGHLTCAQHLATHNGTPKIHTFDGMSPLHAAAQMGHMHIVQWLIADQGLNPNERDFDGATPLHYAASRGQEPCLDWLLREGGARIVLDNLGGSPLHSAAEFGNDRIVSALLSGGCNREITDNEGLTAQELAEQCGHSTTAALIRGEAVNTEPPPPPLTPSTPPSTKVRPPSPLNPPPSRRKSSTSSHTASSHIASSHPPTTTYGGSVSKKAALPPLPAPKPLSPVSPRGAFVGGGPIVASLVVDSLENLPGGRSEGAVFDRSMSLASVASSASSFGYFSPHNAGKTQVVEADIHDAPRKVCVFNSQETGEREIATCPLTAPSSSCSSSSSSSAAKVSDQDFAKATASAKIYITSSASGLPPIKPSFLPYLLPSGGSTPQGGNAIVNDASVPQRETAGASSGRNTNENHPENSDSKSDNNSVVHSRRSQKREPSPTVKERKARLAEVAARSRTPSPVSATPRAMEKTDKASSNGAGVGSPGGSAKSVISISSKRVTIVSTGAGGAKSTPAVATTPLSSNPAAQRPDAGISVLSARRPDSNFIATLSQKFQGSALPYSPGGFRGSHSHVSSSPNAPQVQQTRQQVPDAVTPPPPPPPPSSAPVVNGFVDVAGRSGVNGHDTGSVASSPPPPPPPPSSSLPSSSQQTSSSFRKVDASYTPRPRPQGSVSGSVPGTPLSGGLAIDQQKTDLMSSLSALVQSGTPCASLRRTGGPRGKGGVSEVFSSGRKNAGASAVNGTPSKQPIGCRHRDPDLSFQPMGCRHRDPDLSFQPMGCRHRDPDLSFPQRMEPIAEFDPKNFLGQVDERDGAGNKIPDWRRHLKAKHLALKAQEDFLERRKVEEYEARFKNMPAWKRALIEKRETAGQPT